MRSILLRKDLKFVLYCVEYFEGILIPVILEMELFARKMIEIHKANKGLFNGDKGNTNNSQMRVNSLDMDAHGWTVRAVNDRKGAPKMIRLQCERNRDTLADIYNSRDTDRNVSAMTFDDHHESRLCYKWIASGQIKSHSFEQV